MSLCGLSSTGFMCTRRRRAAGQRLQRLGAADLAAVRGDGGVVAHVLRLERPHPAGRGWRTGGTARRPGWTCRRPSRSPGSSVPRSWATPPAATPRPQRQQEQQAGATIDGEAAAQRSAASGARPSPKHGRSVRNAVVGAGPAEPDFQRPGHGRLGPAGVGRGVLAARRATWSRQPPPAARAIRPPARRAGMRLNRSSVRAAAQPKARQRGSRWPIRLSAVLIAL